MGLIKWVAATFEAISVNPVMAHLVTVPFNWLVEYLHPTSLSLTTVDVYRLQFDAQVGISVGQNVAVVLQSGIKDNKILVACYWRQ